MRGQLAAASRVAGRDAVERVRESLDERAGTIQQQPAAPAARALTGSPDELRRQLLPQLAGLRELARLDALSQSRFDAGADPGQLARTALSG